MKYYFFSACIVIWLHSFFQSWRAAHLLQRYEGMILRPLSISIDLLGLYYLLHKSWWAGAIAVCWGLFIGMVASTTIRREDSLNELTKAFKPKTPVGRKDLPTLSSEAAYRIGTALLQVGFLTLIFTGFLLLNRGVRWHTTIIASAVASIMFGPAAALMCCFTTLVPAKKTNPPTG